MTWRKQLFNKMKTRSWKLLKKHWMTTKPKEKVQENLKAAGFSSTIEGEEKADWVLIDAFDVIVHIFKPEVRAFYSLEKMWSSLKIRSVDN
mgnify:CR=1 FL=1